MHDLHGCISVTWDYPVRLTRGAFAPDNATLAETLPGDGPHRVLFVVDSGLAKADPSLVLRSERYAAAHADRIELAGPPLVVLGGEAGKTERRHLGRLRRAIEAHGLCRHSFVVAIGGGALLDVAGFAAATSHRGVRFVRMPSTVLAQNDAGVGVKNGVNAFGRKNYLGTFAPPFAVISDLDLLRTLPERDLRAGIAEAVKVALIRDAGFFDALERDRHALARFEPAAMERMIVGGAALHLRHICEGCDPFELGSARPLDFGHWSAHRLEEMTGGTLRHGEAVAIGMALDVVFAARMGLLTAGERERVLSLLETLGFSLFHPALRWLDVPAALQSFREHLGGRLTITLPDGIGASVDVHAVHEAAVRWAVDQLERRDLERLRHGGHGVRENLPAVRQRRAG